MTIFYASVNEDWRTERQALRLTPTDTVLCVTGSGDRPLNLLALDPQRVVAIDRNREQNHLLALKVAAMRRLDYDAFVAFVGLHPAPATWRRQMFSALAGDLEAGARTFWRSRIRLIERGLIYQGRWEQFYRRAARVAHGLRPRALPRLFAFDDLEAQRQFLRDTWDRPCWRLLFRVTCSRVVSRVLLRDPAYYAFRQVAAGTVLYRRMARLLGGCLARDSFMVSLVLRGRLSPFDLPPYLARARSPRIRERLDRLTVITGDVLDVVAERTRDFSRFSLSDVPSFLCRSDFEEMMASLARAAVGARVVIRQFLTRYEMPEALAPVLRRDEPLERRLALTDRAFAYEFLVAEVRRA